METALMYDSTVPANLPGGSEFYAAYVNGRFASHAEVLARFPEARVHGIDVIGDAPEQASIIDYEPGCVFSPEVLDRWVREREAFRPRTSVVYTDRANLQTVESTLRGLWHELWVTTLDGTVLTGLKTNAGNLIVATQYAGGLSAAFDTSSVLTSWARG